MNSSTNTQLSNFFNNYPEKNFRKQEIILEPYIQDFSIFYISEGYVRMYYLTKEGKEQTLNIFRPGSYFPIFMAISEVENIYYFEAFTDVKTFLAPQNQVVELLRSNPQILYELTGKLINGFFGIINNFENLMSSSANQKICSTLLLLSKRFGEKINNTKIKINLSLTHEDLSRMVNLSRETTSLEMNKLKKKKLISYSNHIITIENLPNLKNLSE